MVIVEARGLTRRFARRYDVPAAERKRRIQEALAFVGLETAAHKLVRDDSG
jgi:hypothetical protein